MTLSAALDAGLAFGLVVVFFGFIYPGWMNGFTWWGTEVYKEVSSFVFLFSILFLALHIYTLNIEIYTKLL